MIDKQELDPGHGGQMLSEDALAGALKAAGTKHVVLVGCSAAATGLARQLTKDVPGANVWGAIDLLSVAWQQDKHKGINTMTPTAPLTEYKNGKQLEDGKPSTYRYAESGDKPDLKAPLSKDGRPQVTQ